MAALPYATLLEAIGFAVERANGTNVLANEIEGGFMVGFMTATEQQVVTFTATELSRLRMQLWAREPPRVDPLPPSGPRPGPRLPGLLRPPPVETGIPHAFSRRPDTAGRSNVRARLRMVGRYLDEHHATAIVVQERPAGFAVAYTGQPPDDNLAPLTRLDAWLDDVQLRLWFG